MVEHRVVEFRATQDGRVVSGTAVDYRDRSPSHRERFRPGSFRDLPANLALNLLHDDGIEVGTAYLADGPERLEFRAEVGKRAVAQMVRDAYLRGASIEFVAHRESRDPDSTRVVEEATLVGLALVRSPSYPRSRIEVRARSGRVMRSSIPYDADLACECIARSGPGSGGACVPVARFSKLAGDAMAAAIRDAIEEVDIAHSNDDVLAIAGNYRRPLGSAKRGTLRATSTETALEVEIDIPAGAVGDEVVAAHETAGTIVRPLIDEAQSEFVDTDRGREYSRPHLRALLVGATDSKSGWPEPRIDYEGDGRAAPERRRRLWL